VALSFSIVTPTYNAISTIRETLASIQGQDHAGPVEHIVIDGGSRDGTVELLAAEAAAGRLRYVSEPDDGLSDAFNKGVALATGDVVGWLNADDVYEPGALSAIAAAWAERPDAEWATGRCSIIGERGERSRHAVTAYKNLLLDHYSFALHLTNNFVSSPATFVRRDVLAELGALDTRFVYSADYDLWLRLGRRGRPAVADAPVARFRMGEGSLSITGFEQQFAEHAQNARENGDGHRLAVAVNAVTSRLIVWTYRAIMRWRSIRAR
jgi:glycosyltransferase involved in cell wall biosynthesis